MASLVDSIPHTKLTTLKPRIIRKKYLLEACQNPFFLIHKLKLEIGDKYGHKLNLVSNFQNLYFFSSNFGLSARRGGSVHFL